MDHLSCCVLNTVSLLLKKFRKKMPTLKTVENNLFFLSFHDLCTFEEQIVLYKNPTTLVSFNCFSSLESRDEEEKWDFFHANCFATQTKSSNLTPVTLFLNHQPLPCLPNHQVFPLFPPSPHHLKNMNYLPPPSTTSAKPPSEATALISPL